MDLQCRHCKLYFWAIVNNIGEGLVTIFHEESYILLKTSFFLIHTGKGFERKGTKMITVVTAPWLYWGFFFLLVHFQISLWWTAMKVYKKKSICQCKLSSSVVGGLITLPLALVGSYFLLFDFMYVLVNIHKTVTVQTVQTWHVWVVNCRVGLLSVSGDGWTQWSLKFLLMGHPWAWQCMNEPFAIADTPRIMCKSGLAVGKRLIYPFKNVFKKNHLKASTVLLIVN